MISVRTRRALAVSSAAAAVVLGFVACDPSGSARPAEPLMSDLAAAHSHANLGDYHSPEVLKWLAGLRNAMAPLHNFEKADAALYNTDLTGCMEQPGVGGMGHHYGNVDLIDGTIEEFAPEFLLFEPMKNGKKRLVAVEYVVPFTVIPPTDPAPTLHGVPFVQNYLFELWTLHVWVFEHNPNGMFAGWNPRVSCRYAAPTN
jgi:hypothetical protein